MGSTAGHLFYGFDFNRSEDYYPPALEGRSIRFCDWEWEDILCKVLGIEVPGVDVDADSDEYKLFLVKKQNALDAERCEIRYHGNIEVNAHPFVCLKGTHYQAFQGNVVKITGKLVIPEGVEEANKIILAFCEKMGIPYERPDWYFTSSFG